jgi:hypothetical protein
MAGNYIKKPTFQSQKMNIENGGTGAPPVRAWTSPERPRGPGLPGPKSMPSERERLKMNDRR